MVLILVVLQKKKSKCLTHNLWNNLTNHISFFLNSISIKDVSENSYESILSLNGKFQVEENIEITKRI